MAGTRWTTTTVVGVLLLGALGGCSQDSSDSGREGTGEGGRTQGRATSQRPFTLVATGDIIPYPSIMEQARRDGGDGGHDFRPMFSGVKPVISRADVALCHMETPYGAPGDHFTGYPMFKSPPQLAGALADTGYDSCSTASNHSLDAGPKGVGRTLDALDRAGVAHTGTARNRREATRPAVVKVGKDGPRVAHLSYTYGTNGVPTPEGKPWMVRKLKADRVIADARAARRAGADVVVVSPHWGTEWQQRPDAQQRELARRLTASRTDGRPDVDLVVGTHNHVPQPYEKVNGTWVVYGLGDQVASFVPEMYRGNEGSMARFTFAPPGERGGRWTVRRAEYLVSHSDTGPPFRVVRATKDRFPQVHSRVREAVLSRGAGQQGLREAR